MRRENRCVEKRCVENRCVENRGVENRCVENRGVEKRCVENRRVENRCVEKSRVHISWQAQYLVKLERHFSWQAQQFVKFWEIAGARNVVFFHTKCVSKMRRERSSKRRVRDDDFILGLSSDT